MGGFCVDRKRCAPQSRVYEDAPEFRNWSILVDEDKDKRKIPNELRSWP